MLRIITLSLAIGVLAHLAFGQKPSKESPQPITLGVTEKFHSTVLGEDRVLNIYLPPSYKPDSQTKYPVIYLLDGGMDEDFIHVSGIVQFDTFPWISLIPDSILVGIVNVDRKRDFTFPTTLAADKKLIPTSGGSAKFIEFINKELFPFVEDRYRGSKDRTLIGQSLGGLLAAEVLIKQPELFTRYVIISPSVWWDNGSLLNASTEILKTRQSKAEVYIGVGKEGLTSIDPPRVMEVDANVLADKLRRAGDANLNVKFDYLPAEDHATIGHQAVFNAFRLLYPAKRKD